VYFAGAKWLLKSVESTNGCRRFQQNCHSLPFYSKFNHIIRHDAPVVAASINQIYIGLRGWGRVVGFGRNEGGSMMTTMAANRHRRIHGSLDVLP